MEIVKIKKSLNPFIYLSLLLAISCGGVDDDNLQPLFPQNEESDSGSEILDYTGNLVYVLGDVKQAQIRNSLQSTAEIENLLDGFEELGVNGIRITIFPEDEDPNPELFDYLYTRAKAKGFKIMANPALWRGAVRIANKVLYGTPLELQGDTGPSPVGNAQATNIVIQRIKDFADEYEVDWINPFNEDGRPGQFWTVGQMNQIYSGLFNDVNGAELVGPGTWGIPAGTQVLQDTNIMQYITVATTHNLGFDHDAWGGFQNVAGDLPVWDSEVNNNVVYPDRATRIDAALEVGVDGLVLYDSWRYVSLTDGSLNSNGNIIKSKIFE